MNRRQKKKKCKQQTTVFVRCNMPASAEDYRKMKDSIEYQLKTGNTVILPEYLHIEAIIQQNGSRRIEIKDSEEKKTLEEQGKLLKLPCAVGDTVYYRYDGMKIALMRVEKIIIAEYGINLLLAYCGSDEELKYWKINIESTAIDCKIVFLTKEEAEAALKALEQGQI